MKKITAMIACLILAVCSFACADKKPAGNGNGNEKPSTPGYEATGEYIFKNGRTDYTVVIPAAANDKERYAAQELTALLLESTGVKMQVAADNDLTYNENSRYISVGNTRFVAQAGITVNEDAKGINAFQISTKDKSLFLIGGKEYGVVYSVYEFLHDVVNFEQYYTDCYTLETSVLDIELRKYNLVSKPDILRTMGTAGFMAADKQVAIRMRSPYNYTDVYATDDEIPFAHSTLLYLPLSKYYEEHKKWYSDDKSQLCYTAHGDKDEYDAMLKAFTDRLKILIKNCYGKDIHEYDFTNMDVATNCSCTRCTESVNKYGAASAAYIIFANKASEIVFDWMQNDEEGKKYYDEDFKIKIMAYQKFEAAPVTYNKSTKKYEAASPDVMIGDHVTVQIAPIYINYTKSIHDDVNASYYEVIKGWKAVTTSEMDFWLYCTNFHYYMLPYDSFNYMIEYRKILKEVGTLSFNDQTQNGNYGGMSGWHILKAYLSSKLSYNTDLDMNELTDNFFDAYFDVAAEDMKEFYYGWRRFALYQQNVLGAYNGTSSIYFEIGNKKYWEKSILDDWYALTASALEKIKIYKTSDVEKYNTLYKHIVCERASIEYCYLKLYASNVGDDIERIKTNFIEAVNLNNITCPNEGGSMSDFINSL